MTSTYLIADSATMLRRNLIHAWRYPSLTLLVAVIPVMMWNVRQFRQQEAIWSPRCR